MKTVFCTGLEACLTKYAIDGGELKFLATILGVPALAGGIVGAGSGALSADSGHRLEGAGRGALGGAAGGLAGGALGAVGGAAAGLRASRNFRRNVPDHGHLDLTPAFTGVAGGGLGALLGGGLGGAYAGSGAQDDGIVAQLKAKLGL